MSEIDVSNFCLVCYYDKETNKLTHIEYYDNNSSDIEADIKSYEYGYNAVVIKPEQLIGQLQQLKAENEELEKELRQKKMTILMNNDHYFEVDQTNKKLKVENEQLKINLKTACKYCAPGNECALTGNNCHGTSKCIEKYKKLIDEINIITEECKKNFICTDCGYRGRCKRERGLSGFIQRKIREAKEQ